MTECEQMLVVRCLRKCWKASYVSIENEALIAFIPRFSCSTSFYSTVLLIFQMYFLVFNKIFAKDF